MPGPSPDAAGLDRHRSLRRGLRRAAGCHPGRYIPCLMENYLPCLHAIARRPGELELVRPATPGSFRLLLDTGANLSLTGRCGGADLRPEPSRPATLRVVGCELRALGVGSALISFDPASGPNTSRSIARRRAVGERRWRGAHPCEPWRWAGRECEVGRFGAPPGHTRHPDVRPRQGHHQPGHPVQDGRTER